jgi:predicted transcriptional regulator
MHERLPNRRHPLEVYEVAFAKLEALGWTVQNDDKTYSITEKGQALRDEAEQLTDAYYERTFAVLGDELENLVDLLTHLQQMARNSHDILLKLEVWNVLQEILGNMGPHYQGVTTPLLQELNANNVSWGVLFRAQGEAPKPLTLKTLQHVLPFVTSHRCQSIMDESVERGLLQATTDGYTLTEVGQRGIGEFFTSAQRALSKVETLPNADVKRLASLLRNIVKATEEAPEPADKTSFYHSRRTDPGEGLSALAQIDQYVTDLGRYRDDAHHVVWRALGVEPLAWNAFTQIWSGEANTFEAIHEALNSAFSNNEIEASLCEASLKNLIERGWITLQDGHYQLTPQGKYERDTAEVKTNKNFFVGWQTLSAEEINELKTLAERLNNKLKLMAYLDTWQTAQDTMQAFYPFYQEHTTKMMQEAAYQGGDWFFSYVALGVEPEPFTVEIWKQIGPYRNHAPFHEVVGPTAERGFLKANGQGGYVLTETGRTTIQKFFTIAGERLQGLDLLTKEQLTQITDTLKAIVDKVMASPHNTPSTKISRATDPGESAALPVRIDQYITDLLHWRDDAHVVAWQPTGLSGIEFESLSYIWREAANTAEALVDKLKFRGFSVDDYAQALQNLANRNLIVARDNGFVVTAEGRQLREEVEDRTNEIFFDSWQDVSGFALFNFKNTLDQLLNKLKELTPQSQNV